jgi:type IV secretory pathway TrbD component
MEMRSDVFKLKEQKLCKEWQIRVVISFVGFWLKAAAAVQSWAVACSGAPWHVYNQPFFVFVRRPTSFCRFR